MIISPFTPLFFPPLKCDGVESRYVQTFADTDEILVEVICGNTDAVSGGVMREPDHLPLFQISFSQWQVNSSTMLHFATLNLSNAAPYSRSQAMNMNWNGLRSYNIR